jgi:hypothetical protein
VLALLSVLLAGRAFADETIKGQVLGGGAPIAKSTVTLWEASAGAPKQLAQTKTDGDGRFEVRSKGAHNDTSLYIVATGGESKASKASGENTAIALLTVLGSQPPSKVTINELTTIASVWTHNQFIDGSAIKGHALGLRIAAGNMPNFVDLQTGGYGGAIQDSLNGPQTTTLANFATLADALAGCITRVRTDACSSLFAASTGPAGSAPSDTLHAAESIARFNWYKPERLFALLDAFYPVAPVNQLRTPPFEPYLVFAPSAWILPLVFDGGGLRASGKMMFDADGDLWAVSNFTVGFQAQDTFWQGHVAEFAPNGRPISPVTTGFYGGGMEGGTFGAAIDASGNFWADSYGGQSISVFDKSGKPLTPPDGITFNHQLGLMQGIIATPNGDVWVLGISKNQLVYFPKGDWTKGRIVCEGRTVAPCSEMVGPFHLAIDQQDRIWVGNAFGDTVLRFPASDPSKVETFKTGGISESGMNIDSQGNVWVTNRISNSPQGVAAYQNIMKALKASASYNDWPLVSAMAAKTTGGGSITLFKPDGTQAPGSPFSGPSLPGPWAVAVDGDDQVWISNFAAQWGQLAHLCGVRTETCPPGMKTGDPISPPLGYVGGMQLLVDVDIDPAGNVWVGNNWQDYKQCDGPPVEALSTLCGGQGVVVFYGMAKPVRTPQIGPARPY